MRSRRPSLTRRLRSDGGFSAVETGMVAAMLGVVVPIIISVLGSAQTTLEKDISRSTSNDQVRLATQSLDHEVRSGNVVYDPGTETFSAGDIAPGMSVRIYTQTNAPTRGGPRCVQWRITSSGDLERRDWASAWESDPTNLVGDWQIVATGIRNRSNGIAAFVRPQVNILNVVFRANEDSDASKGATVEVRQAVTGRNTVFYPTTSRCGPATPDPALAAADGTTVPPY